MKVGVFLKDFSPDGGGGFTFEDDIFQALFEVAPESKHSFITLSYGVIDSSYSNSPTNLQHINLRNLRNNQFNKRLSIKFSQTYNKIVNNIPFIHQLGHGRLNWIEKVISELCLDMIWNVTPFNGIYPSNIPFISIVWDLQHRLQPWFPEVSSHGEWENREKHFSHLRRASFIIAGTEAGKKEIRDFYQVPSEHIKSIPHPTPRFALDANQHDFDKKSKSVFEKYNIPPGFLFYPAQFWSHKNHVNLLSAVRILRDKHSLILPLVFVGSDQGNERHVKNVVRRLGLNNQVYFLGFVTQKDLVYLYREALALTYLSFFGPENLPPLEAFALSCPVIAANVSGAEEQLGDAALLVDPKDKVEIANAVKSLFDDSALRDKLIARGLARATKWTARDFVKSVFSLLDEFESVKSCWE